DLATMARSTRLTTRVPLDAIHIRPPVDGLPVVEDFLTCCISFLFSGSRLDREPVDLCLDEHIPPPEEGNAYRPVLSVKKGFTRLMSGLFLLLVASDLDPVLAKDLLLPLLPAIIDVWNLPACVTSGQPQEEVSFEAIQLSCQGAERQRKNALQMSLRFEKLMAEHRLNSADADKTEVELLQML
ncbi:unnamed protein product, partial [Durusdinium trenchii]